MAFGDESDTDALCMSFKKSKHIVHKQFTRFCTDGQPVVYVIQKK